MVSLTPASLLSSRISELKGVILSSLEDANLGSRGLALRLVPGGELSPDGEQAPRLDLKEAAAALAYGGVPALALAGFAVGVAGHSALPDEAAQAFALAAERVRGRVVTGRGHLGTDDVALLGIADGLACLRASGRDTTALDDWLVELADSKPSGGYWSARMRALGADLLDGRGRLRADPGTGDIDALALELCLRRTWPSAFRFTGMPARDRQQALMAELLTRDTPMPGELDRAAVWIGALRILVAGAAVALVPEVDEVVRILRATQSALKRWVWEQKPGRAQVQAARWLIDDEAHVQAFLWTVLYPIFGAELRDEQYLPGFGQLQPRYDFGIANLKLIIEVKLIRTRADFRQVEEEIAGDLGVYFSDPERFDRMIAYVYDDCDAHHPELHDGLRNALTERDARVVDVVIVRRPGMIPDRQRRGSA
ncbi:MAG: hypothetical protein RQ966_18810 [Acetobacteraceae bacterium]|nr:hypothetical protein [Acetobacteraceae bacterium]